MANISQKIKKLLHEELRSSERSDSSLSGMIIDTSFANFDPVRTIAKVTNKTDLGLVVMYPDKETGILVIDDPVQITDKRYAEFVEELKIEAQKRPDLDWRKIVERVNLWIRRQKVIRSNRKRPNKETGEFSP
jgi:hypothetical protein